MKNSNSVCFKRRKLAERFLETVLLTDILQNCLHEYKLFTRSVVELNKKHCFVFQFGNTCYSNSVLQALYFCRPFREKVLEYKARNKRTKETLLTCLADLFYSIATQKKKVGSIAPKKFIARLRKEKGKKRKSPNYEWCTNYLIKFLSFYCLFRGIWQLYATRCSRVPEFSY